MQRKRHNQNKTTNHQENSKFFIFFVLTKKFSLALFRLDSVSFCFAPSVLSCLVVNFFYGLG